MRTRVVLCISAICADLPAKAWLMNQMNFNGEGGCLYCTHKGFSVASGKGICRSFAPYEEEVPVRRTHRSIEDDCTAAGERNSNRGNQVKLKTVNYLYFH